MRAYSLPSVSIVFSSALRGAASMHSACSWRQRHGVGFALGLLSALAFPPLGWWPLMAPAIIWLVWSLDASATVRTAAWAGWWVGFGQMLASLFWITNAWAYQSAMPVMVAAPIIAGLCGYLALYTALAAGLSRYAWHDGPWRIALLAGLWACAEYLRGVVFTGFPWNALGSIWVLHALPLAQGAALVGQLGLSAFTCLIFAACALPPRSCSWRIIASGGVAALVGWLWLSLHPTQVYQDLQVHIVQPNVGQELRESPHAPNILLSHYLWLSQRAVEERGPGLVIWPESAIPALFTETPTGQSRIFSLLDQPTVRYRISRRVLAEGGMLFTGMEHFILDGEGQPTAVYNSLGIFNSQGQLIARYDKAHLVPLGEYVPLRAWLKPLGFDRLVAGTLDFSPGTAPRTIHLSAIPPVFPLICYEVIFSDNGITRLDRPAWLLNISNDAWFGASGGPAQHLVQGRMRAIEYGLPMVRGTPTGISAVIDSYGRLMGSLSHGQEAVLTRPLPKAAAATPFSYGGQTISLLFAVGLVVAGCQRYKGSPLRQL